MGWMVNATPQPLYSEKENWYPLYRRLSGALGVWAGAENVTPLRFDFWTTQLILSCYTEYAIPAHMVHKTQKTTYQ